MSADPSETGTLFAAIVYVTRKWRVFPLHNISEGICSCGDLQCRSAGKHPRIDRWQQQATTEPEQLRTWFDQWPDANLGIVTGERIVVLDVDGYNGGNDSMESIFQEFGRPETLQAASGSGDGTHYYFDSTGHDLSTRASLWRGVDVRGNGGYVVAPPSLHKSGKRYIWDGMAGGDAPLAPVPDWLVRAISQGRTDVRTDIVVRPDAMPPTKKFERLLRISSKFAQSWEGTRTDLKDNSGSGYDMSIASCAARDGWAHQEIVDLMIARRREHNDKPKPLQYYQTTAERALSGLSVIAWPRPLEGSGSDDHSTRGGVVNGADLMDRDFPPICWYVEQILHEGATLLSGDPKAGKSYFALQLACAVAAANESVFGKIRVGVHGRVLYLAKDDGSERRFKTRLEALGCTRETAKRLDIMLPGAIPSIQDGLIEMLRGVLDRKEDPYVLLILDTFGAVNAPKSNASVYHSEYSAMRPFQELATDYRIAVIIIHHTNKDKTNRGAAVSSASGSHGITGAVDSALLLERDDRDQNGAKLFGRSRDGGDVHLTLKRRDTGGWECVDEPVPIAKITKERSDVIEAIRTNGGVITKEELASEIDTSVETARRRADRMVDSGELVRLSPGCYALPAEIKAA